MLLESATPVTLPLLVNLGTERQQYIPACFGMEEHLLVHTSMYCVRVCTRLYVYVPVYTWVYPYIPVQTREYTHTHQFGAGSKKVQVRSEPEIFCILFTDEPTALKEYRNQILDM